MVGELFAVILGDGLYKRMHGHQATDDGTADKVLCLALDFG